MKPLDSSASSVIEPVAPSFKDAGFLPVSIPPEQKTTKRRYSMGQVIKHFRRELGMSQEDLAQKASVDRTTIARVECGVIKTLSMGKLEAIAEAIGMDLKTLLIKADSMGEILNYRSQTTRAEFTLEFPEQGFRIVSHVPKRREFFFGKIEIEPHKSIASEKLPHPEQVYLHALDGKILLARERKEYLLKAGDCFAFTGQTAYELFNPDLLKGCSALFITYPSFLPA